MVIDCKKVADEIISESKTKIDLLKKNDIFPNLAIVMVGNNEASKIYVHNKSEACKKAGIKTQEFILDETISECDLIKIIEKLNCDDSVTGILVQLPLPPHINENKICEIISPSKDVDVFNPKNVGEFFMGNCDLTPCTAYGIMKILEYQKIKLGGKNCVVIGRSNIVGKPISYLLVKHDATVTICHSKTLNLEYICKSADIIVSAVGKPKLIKKDMIKSGVIIVDVGICRDENGKICGDVDFENVAPFCSYITSVPKGVGPVTVASLIHNTVETAGFGFFKKQ